jgi:hypothetical protein
MGVHVIQQAEAGRPGFTRAEHGKNRAAASIGSDGWAVPS